MPAGAGLRQAYDLRDAAAREPLALLPIEPPADANARARRAMAVASLAKVWEAASERIRIARGQPLPGSLRPKQEKKRRDTRVTPLAPWSAAAPAPPSPAVGLPDKPTAASADTAATTPTDASVPRPVCYGSGELRVTCGNGIMR